MIFFFFFKFSPDFCSKVKSFRSGTNLRWHARRMIMKIALVVSRTDSNHHFVFRSVRNNKQNRRSGPLNIMTAASAEPIFIRIMCISARHDRVQSYAANQRCIFICLFIFDFLRGSADVSVVTSNGDDGNNSNNGNNERVYSSRVRDVRGRTRTE